MLDLGSALIRIQPIVTTILLKAHPKVWKILQFLDLSTDLLNFFQNHDPRIEKSAYFFGMLSSLLEHCGQINTYLGSITSTTAVVLTF